MTEPETRFGRYVLLERLGQGGMGVVWRVHDPEFDRQVALKRIRTDGEETAPDARARFVREARLAARLRHPSIVPILEAGIEGEECYYTSRLVDGVPLDHPRIAGLPIEERVRIVAEIGRALDHAHGQGVIHRDLKPGNVLVDADGRPHLLDFGLARELGSNVLRLTGTRDTLGTPSYMSPEQAAGRTAEIGPASDQFSLGVVLYELLTGQLPFTGDSLRDILNSVCEADPVRPSRLEPAIGRSLERVLRRAMAQQPGKRFPSMADLVEALESPQPIDRRPIVAAAAVAAVALLGLLVAFGDGDSTPPPVDRPPVEAEGPTAAEAARAALQPALDLDARPDATRPEIDRLAAEARARIETLDDPVEVAFWSGRTWALEGRHDRAIEAWEETLALDPIHVEARLELARVLVARVLIRPTRTDRYHGPLRDMLRFRTLQRIGDLVGGLTREADLDAPRRRLAGIYGRISDGDLKGAQDAVRTARAIDDDSVDLLWLAGSLELRPEGLPLAHAAATARPRDAILLTSFGSMLVTENRWSEARQFLRQAVLHGPGLAEAWFWEAWTHQNEGPRASLPSLDRAIELDPSFVQAYIHRATVRANTGDEDGALADYATALALDSNDPFLLLRRAIFYQNVDRLREALDDLDAALELAHIPDAYSRRGMILAGAGQIDEALASIDRAIAASDAPAVHIFRRALVLLRAGRPDEARTELHRARTAEPVEPGLLAEIDRLLEDLER